MQHTLSGTSSNALLIFTRNPIPGRCKTRLAASIGDTAALAVYRFLLEHTAMICKNLTGVDKLVYFSEHLGNGSVWDPALFQYRLQSGDDLGARMLHAFQEAFDHGYSKVVIIGSDLFDIATTDLQEAFRELDYCEVVIGPASDGGYYLLGMNGLIPELFEDKAWGTDSILRESLEVLGNRKTFLLPERNDVDRYDDIEGNPIFETIIKQSRNG